MALAPWIVCLSLAVIGAPNISRADTTENEATNSQPLDLSTSRIALELSNPVTALRSLEWDIEYTTFRGDLPGADDQTGLKNIFTLAWPFKLSNDKNILVSAVFPVNSDQPIWTVSQHFAEFWIRERENIKEDRGEFLSGHDHLDDIDINIAYGGVNENGLISMIGLAIVAPTSEDQSASREQWLLGPEFALGRVTSWGLYGIRARYLTNVTEEVKSAVNEARVSLFLAYALDNGWQIESKPVILYDAEAVDGNAWEVPLSIGASKTIKIGRFPMKMAFDVQKYLVTPDRFGPDWQLTVSFTPVLSTKLLN